METKKITDAVMGTIVWNEERQEWTGSIDLENTTAQFSLELNEREEISDQLRKTLNFLKNNELQIREKIASEMLALHNEDWNPDVPISQKEFANKIKLEGMNLDESGEAELFYEDGGLFWGHSIVTKIDSSGEISKPYLAG